MDVGQEDQGLEEDPLQLRLQVIASAGRERDRGIEEEVLLFNTKMHIIEPKDLAKRMLVWGVLYQL